MKTLLPILIYFMKNRLILSNWPLIYDVKQLASKLLYRLGKETNNPFALEAKIDNNISHTHFKMTRHIS